MILSLDTETTGTDFYHGAEPYFVTTCNEKGEQRYWEWKVDPITRQVEYLRGDVWEILDEIENADHIVMQNSKFDVQALSVIGVENFPWGKVHDTLIASHILASGLAHDLTSLGIQYLERDITIHEERLHEACEKARRLTRSRYPEWLIAEEGLPCMPSAKGSCWKYDMWLPKLIAETEDYQSDHENFHWHTLLEDYANKDSETTLMLWPVMEQELKKRGLYNIYLSRLKLLPIAYQMERRGITVDGEVLEQQQQEYIAESGRLGKECVEIAKSYSYQVELPRTGSGRNKNLNTFVFDVMKLPVISVSEKTGVPSFDADVRGQYEDTLERGSRPQRFIASLNRKAKLDTAITFMEGYKKYWLPHTHRSQWRVLHPKLNITGTSTLQWSSQNPNEQNISKQSKTNLRKSFGPAPGRVWYSLDAANIQLRIPAYEACEKELIEVFDRPDDPPYYGSYHLVIFDVLHPELFARHGKNVKLPESEGGYEDTWYQWVKNGNFARQFGAQEAKVDATYRVPGGYRKIADRFPKIDALNRKMIEFANRNGYVETIPDRSVDPKHGYPLMTARGDFGRGRVVPTVPLCYHIAGTAQQWMGSAMIRVSERLEHWRRCDKFQAFIIIQVHDELVLDFPAEKYPGMHTPRVLEIKRLMESCGNDIGVPTPVNVERHDVNWSVGIAI